MKILLFGGSGQLGFELKKRASDLSFELFSPVTKEVDITVDKAEEEPDRAYAINAEGVKNVATACAEHGARLIHISTDYVFDGSLGRALTEEDVTNPISVYGASKLLGEEHARAILGEKGVILRTQALYGQKGAYDAKALYGTRSS